MKWKGADLDEFVGLMAKMGGNSHVRTSILFSKKEICS
jgi:hypothetical protein